MNYKLYSFLIDISRIMSSSRNYTELSIIWKGWRDASGKKMKDKYAEFVKLSNEGVKELNMGMNEECKKNSQIYHLISSKTYKRRLNL